MLLMSDKLWMCSLLSLLINKMTTGWLESRALDLSRGSQLDWDERDCEHTAKVGHTVSSWDHRFIKEIWLVSVWIVWSNFPISTRYSTLSIPRRIFKKRSCFYGVWNKAVFSHLLFFWVSPSLCFDLLLPAVRAMCILWSYFLLSTSLIFSGLKWRKLSE